MKFDLSFERKLLTTDDKLRDAMLDRCRMTLKEAKKAIYDMHREDLKTAKSNIMSAKKHLAELNKLAGKNSRLQSLSMYDAAKQEYVESVLFYDFIKKGSLSSTKSIGVDTENYLLGLCDLTGELMRRAVLRATLKDKQSVVSIRDALTAIQGELLKFDLKNGELRKKYDAIKWNLNKVESILYDLELKGL